MLETKKIALRPAQWCADSAKVLAGKNFEIDALDFGPVLRNQPAMLTTAAIAS